ncbi:nucleoside hydrolase [Anabaena cylindrica FACHB-243]|uniref:Inosine/uridine-preferring nucleoside hydrolase n=1 Tax=Anabaena cylindrica (strain ATCC 27899 / PCC 7122) TaxID=272123 RepID=K9ZBX6_ANACC|nr:MULTISPECIES: nucleoside hydrolase [Anabaena]AFZ56698.1 Inosine/uridine-preferring nucleoside hydrolase [Anabaena cylindrica PCC 7122]MBD2419422.1 nucleoside hydrolase [Anabaena cylindrica FACHB-243]MBY5283857.1 nucleoside hydrolase [Anabaena sp. CCAP 1446/1C]MBY5311631.1 nucleoside hydrolase [Anabaena sp. CCAP 1446/1C]MCM2408955.1 nucleoside hydrolase [Anabaena sp. CCAP 1446/1C]
MKKQLVLLDHDGGVDDYLATMLLLTMDHIQLLGIVATPADCYIQASVSATRKIIDLMGFSHIPVAESTVRGINPFPRLYRRDSFIIDRLPILNQEETINTPLVAQTGQDFMVQVLREASEPVTLMVTGPLTTVAVALDQAPEIEEKIAKIVWMGGALNVPGNVEKSLEAGQDGSAEWNVYWDAVSAARVWETQIEVIMCPLDLTNNVPMALELLKKITRQRQYPISDLAGQCYALVAHQDYYFWDVLAAAYLGKPEFYELREWETEIITTGVSQGRTKVVSGGKKIYAMDKVDKESFYAYILQQWAR